MPMQQEGLDKTILQSISTWKLEAESESSDQYFYSTSEVVELEQGRKCFVIGRKGTGKTAICEYFEAKKEYNQFTVKLSFKEFPFNILYSLEDRNYTRPSQYISLWKYFIYSAVLKMMAKNESIDPAVSVKLRSLYPIDPIDQINNTISNWTKLSRGLSIIGLAGQHSVDREVKKIEDIWHELIPSMEEIIISNIDNSFYYVVFDELDEDYRNYWDDGNRSRYTALLTSLFKAVSSVRKIFIKANVNINPIVFLRDDIYELLSDPDSNKWEDDKIYLRWTKDDLKQLIKWRIIRSVPSIQENVSFDLAMSLVFDRQYLKFGTQGKNSASTFDYISVMTHERPRDYVRYFRDCAISSMKQGHYKVSNDTIRGVEKEFSNHLRTELTNEMEGVIPDVKKLFDALSRAGKSRLSPEEF